MQGSKKIWGIFNTLDETKLDNMSEFEIWKEICSLKREIALMLNYLERPGRKDLSVKALINEQFNLEYLIYYTRKFGVTFDMEPVYGEHITQSKSFTDWYNSWKKNTELELSNNTKKEQNVNIQLQKVYQ